MKHNEEDASVRMPTLINNMYSQLSCRICVPHRASGLIRRHPLQTRALSYTAPGPAQRIHHTANRAVQEAAPFGTALNGLSSYCRTI